MLYGLLEARWGSTMERGTIVITEDRSQPALRAVPKAYAESGRQSDAWALVGVDPHSRPRP
jgi:hypothetical protein